MQNGDSERFKQLMGVICSTYYKVCSDSLMRAYWAILKPYDIADIEQAGYNHMSNPDGGQFFPKPADFIKGMQGKEPTPDEIIAAARAANTPMGVLARIEIGTWDLDNADGFYLKTRATEVLQKLPEWRQRAQQGQYSNHEISMMIKHKVNPAAPFAFGLAKPANAHLIENRALAISQSPRHLELLYPPDPKDLGHFKGASEVMAEGAKQGFLNVAEEINQAEQEKKDNSIWGDFDKLKQRGKTNGND